MKPLQSLRLESIYIMLFHIVCAERTLNITLTDQEYFFILSQLPRNNDNVINNDNTPRKHTAQLPVRHSETSILTIGLYTVAKNRSTRKALW